jgi:hypothetical protein
MCFRNRSWVTRNIVSPLFIFFYPSLLLFSATSLFLYVYRVAHVHFYSVFLSLRWPRNTLYPQRLALTSPTSGGRSVGIVRLRTTTTELSFFFFFSFLSGKMMYGGFTRSLWCHPVIKYMKNWPVLTTFRKDHIPLEATELVLLNLLSQIITTW